MDRIRLVITILILIPLMASLSLHHNQQSVGHIRQHNQYEMDELLGRIKKQEDSLKGLYQQFADKIKGCATYTGQKKQFIIQQTKQLSTQYQSLLNIVKSSQLPQQLISSVQQGYLLMQIFVQQALSTCVLQSDHSQRRYVPNFSSQNWIGIKESKINQQYDQNQGIQCPKHKPYILQDYLQCFNCYQPTPIFDFSVAQCVACPSGLVLTDHQCQCPDGQYFDKQHNYCAVQVVWASPIQLNPIYIEPQLIKKGEYYPIIKQPINLNPNSLDPLIIPTKSSSKQTNLYSSEIYSRIIAKDIDKIYQQKYPCPPQKPFYVGSPQLQCINCSQYFDWDQKKCAKCPEGTTMYKHKCI